MITSFNSNLSSRLWSRIRNAPQAVTRALSVSSGAPAAIPPEPASAAPEGNLALVTAHLEYLGYEVGRAAPDGWSLARHHDRYDFHVSTFDRGLRLHCAVEIGASSDNFRAAWLDFLNSANERSHITRFSLFQDPAGVWGIRMRALVTGAYSRPVFAMAMDMWHDDLDLVRRKAAFSAESGADKAEDATVH